MELFQNEPVVQKITVALFVPAGSGAPVHNNRPSHGLAYNANHSTTYRFSDGQILTCSPGQCIYLPQGCSYTVDRSAPPEDPAAGVHAINFHLGAPLWDRPFVLSIRNQAAVLSAFRQAETAWRQKQAGYRETCFSQLYALLGILSQERQDYAPISRTVALLSPALSCIDENFNTRELSVPKLAQLCGISEQYLRRLFHKAFGVSPAVYIRNKRLGYARELLSTGEYSVSRAAAAAGFNDSAYFSREFRKFTGHAPSRDRTENIPCTSHKNKL